ncbi:hypothetical protein [Kitasatospora sp. McL0602]|uniref:bestrophin-like domain n=1 Tax=Kitasatospora sp. McL0602 TaxID=3439530 RepID=UPI003F8AC003
MWKIGLVALAGGLLALAIGIVLGRSRGSRDGSTSPQALAFAGAAVLGFFALFTGFSIAGAWQQMNSARQHTYEESRALTEVYWSTRDLPEAGRTVLRDHLRGYTRLVVDEEWSEMARGRGSVTAWEAIDRARSTADAVHVEMPAEVTAKSDVLRNLTDVYAKRNSRLADIRAVVPGIALGGLLVGAVFVVATPPMIGLTANVRNLMLMAFVGASVAFGVSLVVEFSGPFSGVVKVDPTAFQLALVRYDQIDSGAGAAGTASTAGTGGVAGSPVH